MFIVKKMFRPKWFDPWIVGDFTNIQIAYTGHPGTEQEQLVLRGDWTRGNSLTLGSAVPNAVKVCLNINDYKSHFKWLINYNRVTTCQIIIYVFHFSVTVKEKVLFYFYDVNILKDYIIQNKGK